MGNTTSQQVSKATGLIGDRLELWLETVSRALMDPRSPKNQGDYDKNAQFQLRVRTVESQGEQPGSEDISAATYGFGSRKFFDHDGTYLPEFEDPNTPLYRLSDQVPQLPVPSLESSIRLLLSSAQALSKSEKEFAELETLVKAELSNPDSLLHKLHNRVLQRAESAKANHTSWFIDMWNRWAYLTFREPVAHNVSYFLQMVDDSSESDYLSRAAKFIHCALQYRQLVVSGRLAPDRDPKSGIPFENSQHRFMFHCCRIPCKGQDVVRSYDPNSFKTICVARRNLFYTFEFDTTLSPSGIRQQLEWIVKDADSMSESNGNSKSIFNFMRKTSSMDEGGFGLLTADHRDAWTRNRDALMESNRDQFERIESSAFLVCLDSEKPETRKETAHHFLNGGQSSAANRYWDKTSQIVVTENGKLAYLAEHSMVDGMTTGRFMTSCGETLKKMGRLDSTNDEKLDLSKPIRICFTAVPKKMVARSQIRFSKLIANKDCDVFIQSEFGSDDIKKFGISPDAFAQMAIQLAGRKVFGTYRATYESTQTRSFQHGRTEVTRSCSLDSTRFCDAILARVVDRNSLRALLIQACSAHSEYTSRAVKGQGCDRHLLGMQLSALKSESLPAMFTHKLYKESSRWGISTSCINSDMLDGWGFGEVVQGGVGVAYAVLKTHMRFTVSSERYSSKLKPISQRQKQQFCSLAEDMCAALGHSIKEMRQLFAD